MASELIERDMYNGTIRLVHNPLARGSSPRYKIMSQGAIVAKPKGVTTIMGSVLAKDLMDWGISCCVEELKEKLPVITEDDLKLAAKAYAKKRDKGANTGTEAHAMVEQYLKDVPVVREGHSDEAYNAFAAFTDWFEAKEPTVINVEEVIYSKNFEFAGTYDCMLEIDGKVHLCDLKTTNSSRKAPNGVYAENFIQLGAYAAAHEEQRLFEGAEPSMTKLREIEDLTVISAKKNGKMDVVSCSELGLTVNDCMEMALKVMNLYRFLTLATKELGGK